jgi:hypothetical protein
MEFTQFLTEMSTRNISGVGGKARPALNAGNLTVINDPNVKKIWERTSLHGLFEG